MKPSHAPVAIAVLMLQGFACSSEGADDPLPNASGSGGTSPVTAAGSGGTAPLAGSTGGNTGGRAGAGGAGTAGSAAGTAGSGNPTGGSGGQGGSNAGGAAGAGGGSNSAVPSAGCSKGMARPAGGAVSVNQDHYFLFPESYDGKKPLPVLMGFHGCGSGNRGTNKDDTEWNRLTEASDFAKNYVRATPISSDSGGCWSYNTDIARVKKMYDELIADYCVDTSRVFATGHSSGAQFVVQILLTSHQQDAKYLKFKAVAPVAASDYGPMTGPIPAMYIQGKMDQERGGGDGHETVARFRAANSCMDSSTPYTEVMGCQSGQTAVDPGCVSYAGCQAPTIWCSHNDPAYGTTMHGVPCFGVKAMYDFFTTLP
jgi:polyhydroxybutyrate depolymerase